MALIATFIVSGVAVTNVSALEHEVEPGESLWEIADEYDTTVDELVQINDLKTTVIQPKQILYIHDKYVVERGDTLLSISQEYDVTVDELMEWNDLKTSLIVIDQELEIKGKHIDQEEKPETNAETAQEATKGQHANGTTEKQTNQTSQGKTLTMTATAYTAGCNGCSGITYTGIDLNKNPNAKVIAVDPSVIPLGTEVYVEGYGYAIAADVGSAIKGNKIDLHVPTNSEAKNWGVRSVKVTIVD